MPKPGKKARRENQRYLARQNRGAARAEERAQAAYERPTQTGGSPGGAPAPQAPTPAAPKYGPFMQRAQADAQLRYGDPILRAQGALANTGTYWEQYKKDVAAAQAAVAGRYTAAQQQVTGPTVGPAVQSAEGGEAAASRALMDKSYSNLLTSQGAAQADYFDGRQTVGAAQKLVGQQQALGEINRLANEKTQYALTRKGELKDAAWTKRLEAEAFNLNVNKANQSAAQARIDDQRADRALDIQSRNQRLTRKNSSKEVNQYGYSSKEWQRMTPAERQAKIKSYKQNTSVASPKAPGAKGLTPAQQRAAREKRNEARTKVDTVVADMGNYGNTPMNVTKPDPETGKPTVIMVNGKPQTRKPTRDEVFARLRKEGASQDQITVALALRHGKSTWTAAERAAAKRLGYGVPKKYRPKKNQAVNQSPGGDINQ